MASDVATESQRSGASIEAFAFDVEGLARLGQQQHQSYVRADPFPHAMLDGLVPERVCDRVLEEFPRSNRNQWIRFHDHTGKKLASRVESQFGPFTRSSQPAHVSRGSIPPLHGVVLLHQWPSRRGNPRGAHDALSRATR